jgi:toxin ParE1/3/4
MSFYRLARHAKADLDDIWLFIAQDAGIETADRFIDTITDRFLMLASMPEVGRVAEHIEQDVRVFPVEAYLIYYRISPGWISISRVIHGMRDQQSAWHEHTK